MPRLAEQYTGREYELDAYGSCEVGPEAKKVLLDLYKLWNELDWDERNRIHTLDIIRLIAREYAEDPIKPKKPLARDIRDLLLEKMNLDDEPERLGFYSSVDTVLDRKGIDGFFMLDGEPRLAVTTDITLQEETKKYSNFPTHVILHGNLLQNEDENTAKYIERLMPFIDQIKEGFDSALSSFQNKKGETHGR